MEFVRSDKNAQWVVPLVLGVLSCICSCSPMLYLWGTVIIPIDAENMPLDQAFAFGINLGQELNTWQLLYTFLMYCIPPSLLVIVGTIAFFVVRGIQQRNAPTGPKPPVA